MSAPTVRVPLNRIVASPSTQARAALYDEGTVSDYRFTLDALPPVELYDDGENLHVGDGNNRIEAHRREGRADVPAIVRQGTARDALLHSIRSNHGHGLRRSNADKRRSVQLLLTDPEWSKDSDHNLARIAGVDHKTVGNIRYELRAGEFPRSTDRWLAFDLLLEMAAAGLSGSDLDKLDDAMAKEKACRDAGQSFDIGGWFWRQDREWANRVHAALHATFGQQRAAA